MSKKDSKNEKRPLRVLKIGNIANNAYQNAKVLRQMGIECDVMCNDYYHSMGCPEWDDADFEGVIENHFFPAWHKLNLNGYKRPAWFAQGPLDMCIRYFSAFHQGKKTKAWFWWKLMGIYRRYRHIKSFVLFFDTIRYFYYVCLGLRNRIMNKWKEGAFSFCATIWYRICLLFGGKVKPRNRERLEDEQTMLSEMYPEYNRLLGEYILDCKRTGFILKEFFDYYDVIFGYATSGIFPYFAGYKNLVSYEHGTIREIPFLADDIGSATLLAYGNSKVIYSTNIDCYEKAKYIARPKGAAVVCGLHGLDVERIIHMMDSSKVNMPVFEHDASIPLIYSPCRFDYAVKGNDIFLQAIEHLADDGYEFIVVLAKWGNDLHKAEQRIKNSDSLRRHVRWIEALDRRHFYHGLTSADAVVDNILLPAYGAIAIETMCANKPVLIQKRLLPGVMELYTEVEMPYYPIDNTDDIYEALLNVIKNTADYQRKSKMGRIWARRYHGYKAMQDKMLEAIKIATQE